LKIALLVFVGALAAVVVVYFFYSHNKIINSKSGDGAVTIEAPLDHYASNGFNHIEPYVSRLLVPTNYFKLLAIYTPDETRGVALDAKDGVVHVTYDVEWRKEPQKEAAIRAFFGLLGIAPSRDYLDRDATRILEYPLSGNIAEVTALTKRILQEVCGVSPTEALDISYGEQ
jgi:hypothetical protein